MHFHMDMLGTTLIIPRESGQYCFQSVGFPSLRERNDLEQRHFRPRLVFREEMFDPA